METASASEIKTVAVVGAGTMGNGIAHVMAHFGHTVWLIDVGEELLGRGVTTITKNLGRMVKSGKITEEEKASTLDRIRTSVSLSSTKQCDFVVEAIIEDLGVKREVFSSLDSLCKPSVVLASNTSSISITEIATVTRRPEKVIGMHFMNPVPVMKLVEIIRGQCTAEETCVTIRGLTKKLGKTPVEAQDFPGFIANRVLMPMINEAIYTLMEGVATIEDIDMVMKLGMNHPMGPLTLADFIGLDVCLHIMEVLHHGFGDPKYRPCPLLRQKVAAGHFGRKSGRGFYTYDKK